MKTLRIFAMIALLCALAGAAWGTEAPAKVAPPDLPGSSMWIPWTDFKDILDKLTSQQQGVEDPDPPYEAVIGNAFYLAQVGESGVTVTATVEVIVLKKKGWASVPVIRTGVPLSFSALDGKPTALATRNDGMLHLVAQGYGSHTLTLKYRIALTKNSGPEQFSLQAVRAQVNRLEVRIGRPDMRVRIAPNGYMESDTAGATTVATGTFPPTDRVTVSWARSVPKSVKETARLSAAVRTMLTVGEGLGVYTTIVDYDILHKPISEFQMLLPPGVTVADVSTEGLVDWNVEKSEQAQTLSVSISFEAIGRHPVAVTYEKALPAGEAIEFATADLVVKDVVHEVGHLAVAVRTNIQVNPKEGGLKNLVPIDPNELPPDLRGSGDQKVLYGFKYIKHPASAALEVVKHKDASVLTCEVENAHYRIMVTDRGKQLLEATYRIANRSLQYLSLTLPKGMDLWGVYRDGAPTKAAESDGKILLPIFQGGLNRTSTLKVLAYRRAGPLKPIGARRIELPTLDVGANKVFLDLYLPSRFRYFGFGGKLRRTYQTVDTVSKTAINGKDVSGLISSGEGRGVGDDRYDMDEETIDKNVRYRNAWSQVQQQVTNIPFAGNNLAYSNAMARGALPVEFNVSWEGAQHRFSTSIVDPDEATHVRFFYTRRARSPWISVLVILFAGVVGYLVTWFIVSRKDDRIGRPTRTQLGQGAIFLALLGLGAMIRGSSKMTIAFGLLLGALVVLIRFLAAGSKDKPKVQKPVPAPPPPPMAEPKPSADPENSEEGGAS